MHENKCQGYIKNNYECVQFCHTVNQNQKALH